MTEKPAVPPTAPTRFLCPVCGFLMEEEPKNYNICPSCGTEFDNDDQNATIEELRMTWIRAGCLWWSDSDQKPDDFNPCLQLARLIPSKVTITTGSNNSLTLTGVLHAD